MHRRDLAACLLWSAGIIAVCALLPFVAGALFTTVLATALLLWASGAAYQLSVAARLRATLQKRCPDVLSDHSVGPLWAAPTAHRLVSASRDDRVAGDPEVHGLGRMLRLWVTAPPLALAVLGLTLLSLMLLQRGSFH